MNYLKEINAFHIRQETNPLTTAAAHLWFVLMDINNRAGWVKQFSVAATLLCAKSAIKEGTFKRARKELQEKGYIHVASRGANRAAIYQMISLLNVEEKSHDDNVDHNMNDSMDHSVNDTPSGTVGALYKQDLTKQKENITTTPADVIAFFEENFGKANSYVTGDLEDWINDLGKDLVLSAMKRALEHGKATWGYTKGILLDWVKKDVRTAADIQADDAQFKQKQAKRSMYSKRSQRTEEHEVIPDWFKEREKQRQLEAENKQKQAVPRLSKEEEDRERAELKALLAKHASG